MLFDLKEIVKNIVTLLNKHVQADFKLIKQSIEVNCMFIK